MQVDPLSTRGHGRRHDTCNQGGSAGVVRVMEERASVHGVVRSDGSDQAIIVSAGGDFSAPSWSPDGRMLVFSYDVPEWEKQELDSGGYPMEYEIYVVDVDGSDVHQLTDIATPRLRDAAASPDWG
jgi:hypothetical protein